MNEGRKTLEQGKSHMTKVRPLFSSEGWAVTELEGYFRYLLGLKITLAQCMADVEAEMTAVHGQIMGLRSYDDKDWN